jgi:hypothetical protein
MLRKLSLAFSTCPSRLNSITACARLIAVTLPSDSTLRSFAAVMSSATLTTLNGRPSTSRIGL